LRAVVCVAEDGPGGLRLQAIPSRELESGEIRIAVAAAGVNFVDLLMTRGTYQYRPPLPFIPGLEAAGTVVEAAPGAGIEIGSRVIIGAKSGMYASEAIVHGRTVWRVPDGFSMAEAACFRVAAHSARYALVECARLRPGETLLVLGAGGGLGLASVEIGCLLGAKVIAAASTVAKLRVACARGARHAVNYVEGSLVEQVRSIAPDGVDVVFDPVGGDLCEQSLRVAGWGGRVLIAGFASGRIGIVPANLPLLKGYSVLGVRAGEAVRRDPSLASRSADDIRGWAAQGHLRPQVSATFPLSAASRALEMIESRQAVGRIALLTDESAQ
jgi:NADPH2:quinone reductase